LDPLGRLFRLKPQVFIFARRLRSIQAKHLASVRQFGAGLGGRGLGRFEAGLAQYYDDVGHGRAPAKLGGGLYDGISPSA
jgi:hypothetical protein